jgi:signal peptidase I
MDTQIASDQPARRPSPSLIGTVVRLMGSTLAGLLVAGALVALVATQFLGYHALGVSSDSMAPALRRGDLVVTRPVAINTVGQGDIVAYDEGELIHLTVVHRVVGVVNLTVNTTDSKTGTISTEKSRLLQTKGDANPAVDGQPVGAERFKGLVFITVPVVGGVLGAGIVQQILLAVAIGTGIAWLVYEIVRLRRRRTPEG